MSRGATSADTPSSLPAHMTSPVPGKYECINFDTCGKEYGRWGSLREHVKKSDHERCHEFEAYAHRSTKILYRLPETGEVVDKPYLLSVFLPQKDLPSEEDAVGSGALRELKQRIFEWMEGSNRYVCG